MSRFRSSPDGRRGGAAEASISPPQPAIPGDVSGETDDDRRDAVRRALPPRAAGRSALLPLLHALQDDRGHVADALVPHVADLLNVSRADVHGVLTFYHGFRRGPPGRHVVQICRAEACQARGGRTVERLAVDLLGVAMGATRTDGMVTLESVYCLGLCPVGPAALVDGEPIAKLDADRLADVAAALR